MPKAKVMPPRTPRGEAAKVTIANQARQIENLTKRVESLLVDRDANYESAKKWRDEHAKVQRELGHLHQFRQADVARLEECQAKLASTEQKFEGYRMHVRDMLEAKE